MPLFNDVIPGPPINCVVGDTLRINVVNDMKKEELSVNWQGMIQSETNHMDGVPYITETTIRPGGGSRIYEFAADAAGTFHYHSNQEFLRSGLHGIIVVKERDSDSDPVAKDHGEYEELVATQHAESSHTSPTYPALVVSDLYHKDGATMAAQLDNGIGDWIWQPQSILVNGYGLHDCSVNHETPYYYRCAWQCPADDVQCIDEVRCSKAIHPIDGRMLGPYVVEERGSNALYNELVAGEPDLYTDEVQAEWAKKCGWDHIAPFLYGTENEMEADGRPIGATGAHQTQFLNWGRPTGTRCDLPDLAKRDPRCISDGTWPFKGINKGRTYDHLRSAEDGTYDVAHFDGADLQKYNATCRALKFYTGDAQPESNHYPFGLWGQSPLRCDDYPQKVKKSETPTVFEVEAGKTYRLRVINVASLLYTSLVIEGHTMTVVQVDGAYVEPFETSFLDLWNGQTYSILIKAIADTPGDFWIGLSPRLRGYTRMDPGKAILRYVVRDPSTGETSPVAAEGARLPVDSSRPIPKWWDAAPTGRYVNADTGKKTKVCPVALHPAINDGEGNRDFDRCPGFYPNVFDQNVAMELQFRYRSRTGMYELPSLTKPGDSPVMVVNIMNTNDYRDLDTYKTCVTDYGNAEIPGTFANSYSWAPFLGDDIWDPLHSIFRPGTDIAGQAKKLCGVQRWSINNITYPFRYADSMASTEKGASASGASGAKYEKSLLEHAYDGTLDDLDNIVDVRRPDENPLFSSYPYYSSIDPAALGGGTKYDLGIPPASNELYNIMRFELGEVFDVVLQNSMYLRYWTNAFYGDKHNYRSASNHHPYHSHGFNFWALGYGEGNFNATAWNAAPSITNESSRVEYAEGDIWHKNLVNPPLRNLAVNFAGGWTVLRIKADNPGLWWFHCTVMAHFHQGMGMTFGFGLNDLPKPNPFSPKAEGDTSGSEKEEVISKKADETSKCETANKNDGVSDSSTAPQTTLSYTVFVFGALVSIVTKLLSV